MARKKDKDLAKIHDAFDSLCVHLNDDADVDIYNTLMDEPDIYCVYLDDIDNHSDTMDLVDEGIRIGQLIKGREYHTLYDDAPSMWIFVGTVDEILAKFQRIRSENPAKPPPEEPNDFQI